MQMLGYRPAKRNTVSNHAINDEVASVLAAMEEKEAAETAALEARMKNEGFRPVLVADIEAHPTHFSHAIISDGHGRLMFLQSMGIRCQFQRTAPLPGQARVLAWNNQASLWIKE